MEMGSKPCQDQFLHAVLVHYRKIRKYRQANGTRQKKYLKKYFKKYSFGSIIIR